MSQQKSYPPVGGVGGEEHATTIVGQSITRVDAIGKVTGAATYPGDLDRPGQAWLKVLFSARVHARVTAIDTRAAESLPGVLAVLTARDVPVNEYGLITFDQPVLCGPGSPAGRIAKAGADIVRCVSDQVAVVVAETEAIAAAALNLIEVTYADLPIVTDPARAMAADAPRLHERAPDNLICRYKIRKGNMAAGWAQAAVIVEGEYSTSWQEHAYLQPEAGLAYYDEEGRLTVVVAGQWAHEDQGQIAHALDLPEDQVRVIYPAIGGAFGGREDMSVQIILALAAHKIRRPVKIIWSRSESIIGHHKRHPIAIQARWGADRDGHIVAAEATIIGDGGAYAYTTQKVMGNAQLLATGPYVIPNIQLDCYGVYTNNIPAGAFRGFGGPQGLLAAEGQMNKLAAALRIDPVTIRLRNAIGEGDLASTGTPLPAGVSMTQVIAECAAQSGYWEATEPDRRHWTRRPLAQQTEAHKRRGVGIACGFKNVGFSFGFPEQSWATIELHGASTIEAAIVRYAGAEVGQGAHTAFTQMAAEALNLPLALIRLAGHDTAHAQTAGSASASRLTFMAGNAIRGAATAALTAWQNEDRPAIGVFQYRPPATSDYDKATGRAQPNFAYGYVAQIVEVEVDLETGLIELINVVSANDVGRAINPKGVQGQIEGAVVQAQGYALLENLISVNGVIKNPYLSTYLIPSVLDVPRAVKAVILEYADPIGPWGARGMAEMPFLCVAPAIAAAIHDATGVWIDALPMTPDRVIAALNAHPAQLLSPNH